MRTPLLAVLIALPALALAQDRRVIWTADLKSDSKGSGHVADLDGDGVPEVVFGTYFGDEHLYAIDGKTGRVKWRFKSAGGPLDASVAIADLDGDGKLEVLTADSAYGNLFCLDGRGKQRWTLKLPSGTDSPPAIGDLTGDGKPEVVMGSMWKRGGRGDVSAIDPRTRRFLWKREVKGCVQSEPALTDLNGDGRLDVVVTSWRGDRGVHAFDGATGKSLWTVTTRGTPKSMGMYHGVTVVGARVLTATCEGDVYAIDRAGKVLWRKQHPGDYLFAPTSAGDLDGDGKLELVVGGRQHVYVHRVDTGALVWKHRVRRSVGRGAALVDTNGDGGLDVVLAIGTRLIALDGKTGREVFSFQAAIDPKDRLESISSAPLIADLDGDGKLDAFVVCGRGYSGKLKAKNRGRAYAIRLGAGRGAGWTTFRGGLRRLGVRKRRRGPF